MSQPERFSGDACHTARTSSVNSDRSATRKQSAPGSCYGVKMVVRASPESRPKHAFNGVKVFAATMFRDREQLGDRVTHWLREHPEFEMVDMIVTQSSDAEFHCITITVFYSEAIASRRVAP
jgi:hypothetical protein